MQSWIGAGRLRLRLMKVQSAGKRGRRDEDARIQRFLGEVARTSEYESTILNQSRSGMRDMQLSLRIARGSVTLILDVQMYICVFSSVIIAHSMWICACALSPKSL